MTARIPLLMLAVLVVGCTTSTPVPERSAPVLPEPLSPASLGRTLSLSQTVTGSYGGEARSLRVELEVNPARLVAVGLTPLGLPLFTLEQEGSAVKTTQMSGVDIPIDPGYVLSDIQLTYWPDEVVRRSLAKRGFRFESRAGRRRVYRADGSLLVDIALGDLQTVPNEILIQHYDPPYQVRITTFGQGE